jgi:acetoin utilization protein AcuB
VHCIRDEENELMSEIVGDWMSADVVVASPDEQLGEAIRKLRLNRIRHLCVVDTCGELVGILSDRDVSRALPSALSEGAEAEYSRMFERITVEQLMTRSPITVEAKDTLTVAADQMVEARISALPVMDGVSLVGILTETDCMRALARGGEEADRRVA